MVRIGGARIAREEEQIVLNWLRNAIANDEPWTRDFVERERGGGGGGGIGRIKSLPILVSEARQASLLQRVARASVVRRGEVLLETDGVRKLHFVWLSERAPLRASARPCSHHFKRTLAAAMSGAVCFAA